ncbi:MAG: response regulator [Bacteroidales bacterium]|nr:response regulator [Bacteroidales bacterium]
MKILVVDDIFTNRLLIKEIVSDIGFEVEEAINGKEAIDTFSKKDFDVILMDIEMPVMNGIETTQHIRRHFDFPKCDVPIIALTAHNPSLFFDDYSDVGFSQIITKPYSLNKIKTTIENVCGRHLKSA